MTPLYQNVACNTFRRKLVLTRDFARLLHKRNRDQNRSFALVMRLLTQNLRADFKLPQ